MDYEMKLKRVIVDDEPLWKASIVIGPSVFMATGATPEAAVEQLSNEVEARIEWLRRINRELYPIRLDSRMTDATVRIYIEEEN
jgi:hypothetical protein